MSSMVMSVFSRVTLGEPDFSLVVLDSLLETSHCSVPTEDASHPVPGAE